MENNNKSPRQEAEESIISEEFEIQEDTVPHIADESEDASQSEVDKLKQDLNSANDKYLRLMAEYDNFRKRTQKERDSIYPLATAAAVEKFVPLCDSFERALASECSDENFKKGIIMIENSLKDIFAKLGVESFGEAGETFDPQYHNAVMHEESEEVEASTVAEVFQKGYKIGDKIIRYAMVKVLN